MKLTILLCLFVVLGFHKPGRLLLLEPTMHRKDNREVVWLTYEISKLTNDSAVIMVVSSGHLAYHLNRKCVDILGKEDAHIAMLECHRKPGLSWWEKLTEFYPGHLKWDYGYSVKELKPDVIAQIWEGFQPYAEWVTQNYVVVPVYEVGGVKVAGIENGSVVFVRRNSTNILWDSVAVRLETFTKGER